MTRLALVPRIERVGFCPGFRFIVQPIHVGLELPSINPPDATAPQFDGREIARAHQGVHLGDAHIKEGRNVLEGEEAGLDDGPGATLALGRRWADHLGTIAPAAVGYRYLTSFAAVWVGTRAI